MTLQGVIRGLAKEASRTRLGVSEQLLADMGVYCTQNAEAIAARLDRADALELELRKWRGIADALAMVLRKNGVGGRQFKSALQVYEEAKELDGPAAQA